MLRFSHLALLVTCLLALVFGLSFSVQPAQASLFGTPAPSTDTPSLPAGGCLLGSFTNKLLLGDGLGSNFVRDVYAVGSTVYAATDGRLSVSADAGNTFVNKTMADGLGDNGVLAVYAEGSTIYATGGGALHLDQWRQHVR